MTRKSINNEEDYALVRAFDAVKGRREFLAGVVERRYQANQLKGATIGSNERSISGPKGKLVDVSRTAINDGLRIIKPQDTSISLRTGEVDKFEVIEQIVVEVTEDVYLPMSIRVRKEYLEEGEDEHFYAIQSAALGRSRVSNRIRDELKTSSRSPLFLDKF